MFPFGWVYILPKTMGSSLANPRNSTSVLSRKQPRWQPVTDVISDILAVTPFLMFEGCETPPLKQDLVSSNVPAFPLKSKFLLLCFLFANVIVSAHCFPQVEPAAFIQSSGINW